MDSLLSTGLSLVMSLLQRYGGHVYTTVLSGATKVEAIANSPAVQMAADLATKELTALSAAVPALVPVVEGINVVESIIGHVGVLIGSNTPGVAPPGSAPAVTGNGTSPATAGI